VCVPWHVHGRLHSPTCAASPWPQPAQRLAPPSTCTAAAAVTHTVCRLATVNLHCSAPPARHVQHNYPSNNTEILINEARSAAHYHAAFSSSIGVIRHSGDFDMQRDELVQAAALRLRANDRASRKLAAFAIQPCNCPSRMEALMREPRLPTNTSHVTRHTSHVTRHSSHVTRHTSHVTRHTSHW